MRVVERSFSDLLRHPNDVAADLDSGDVLLRRRDESDLRLTLADRDAERSDVFRAQPDGTFGMEPTMQFWVGSRSVRPRRRTLESHGKN